MEIKLIKFSKRESILIGIALVVGVIFGAIIFSDAEQSNNSHVHQTEENEITTWTCSMHPQIRQNEPGICPLCAMDLAPVSTIQSEDENIDPNEIQMTESAMGLADIQTVTVQHGMPVKSIQLFGKVKADERNIAELTARFGGRIEKLFINYTGQNVKKGQKLGTIYSPDLITAQKELLEAVKYKETNPAFYTAARSKLKLWELSENQIDDIEFNSKTKLYFDILSPISGTVTKRHITIGDYIKEGSPLFEVIDLTSVWIMFDAYESDLPWIKVNDKTTFSLKSLPGKMYSGNISYIDPFLNAQTRVAQVRVEISNPELTLKPEMFANGVLESQLSVNSNELLIPKSSILWTGKRAVVYVKVPNREAPTFLYREIVLGPEAGNFYVVADGLFEGEKIAINGVFKIDASAQLAGKASMMNPAGGITSTGHDHGEMKVENTDNSEEIHSIHESNLNHEMFKVSGSCGMCKDKIEETSLGLNGVNSAEWDLESKALHVTFNADKIKLIDIHKAVAAVGYDTELETAPDDVYNELPGCCKYTRK